jgi:hypothetical protein
MMQFANPVIAKSEEADTEMQYGTILTLNFGRYRVDFVIFQWVQYHF